MEQENLYKITFIDGEYYCRIDGILATPEYIEKLCGTDDEWFIYNDKFICDNNHLYTDETNLYEIIKQFSEYNEPIEEYDMILSKGYGMASHSAREKLNDTFVIYNPFDVLNGITIKPMSAFNENYPNYNHNEYQKIMNSLDYFYKHKH